MRGRQKEREKSAVLRLTYLNIRDDTMVLLGLATHLHGDKKARAGRNRFHEVVVVDHAMVWNVLLQELPRKGE